MRVLLLFAFLHVAVGAPADSSPAVYEWEHKLREKLFSNYDRDIIPVTEKTTGNVTVSYGISLINVEDTDDESGLVVIDTWLRQSWTDHRLTWNPDDFGGIESIRVCSSKIWKPDVTTYNAQNLYEEEAGVKSKIVVMSSGYIFWVPPKRITLYCDHHEKHHGNEFQCSLKIGSWTYDGQHLDLGFFDNKDEMDLTDYSSHEGWTVTENHGVREDKYYPCCPENYPLIRFNFTIKHMDEDDEDGTYHISEHHGGGHQAQHIHHGDHVHMVHFQTGHHGGSMHESGGHGHAHDDGGISHDHDNGGNSHAKAEDSSEEKMESHH